MVKEEKKVGSKDAGNTPELNTVLEKLSPEERMVLLKGVRSHIGGKGEDRKGKPQMLSFEGYNESVPKTKQTSKYSKPEALKEIIQDNTKYEIVQYPDGRQVLRQWDKNGDDWGKLIPQQTNDDGTVKRESYRIPNGKVRLPTTNRSTITKLILDVDTTTEKPMISREEAEKNLA